LLFRKEREKGIFALFDEYASPPLPSRFRKPYFHHTQNPESPCLRIFTRDSRSAASFEFWFGVAGKLSSRDAVGFVVSAVSLLWLSGRQEYSNGFSK
jgi:hypothetical protein